MAWEPFTKPLGAILSERLASPLIGSFVISWLIINWKVVVILLSQTSVNSSFALIERLYGTDVRFYGLLFVAPLASALVYLFALPFVSRPVTKWWLKTKQDAEDDRIKIQRLAVLEVPKSLEILDENHKLRNDVALMRTERNQAVDKAKEADAELVDVKGQLLALQAQYDASQKLIASSRELQADLEQKYDHALQAKHVLATDLRMQVGITLERIGGITADLMNSSSYAKLQNELIDAVGGPSLLTPQMMQIINDAISTLRKRHHVEFLEARSKLETLLGALPDSVVGTSTTLKVQDISSAK